MKNGNHRPHVTRKSTGARSGLRVAFFSLVLVTSAVAVGLAAGGLAAAVSVA